MADDLTEAADLIEGSLHLERDAVLAQLEDRTNQTWAGKRRRWAKLVRAQAQEIERQTAQVAALQARANRAERTLTLAGYSDEGGELWKPPLGPSAAPLLDKIDALQARLDALMLEHCPEDMTPEQVAEWGRNQVPAQERTDA